MQALAESIIARLRSCNRILALAVGAGLGLCAVFIITEIIIRLLGGSLGGTDEIAGYTMAITTSWGMAFCLLELGHVRIDLLRTRLGKPARALVDLACMVTLTAVAVVIAFRCWPVVERSLTNGSRSNTSLEVPLAWVQVPWFMGWGWFALSASLTLFAATVFVLRRRFGASEDAIGIRTGERE